MATASGGKGPWARDPRYPTRAVLTVQAVGNTSVVRWRRQVVQGPARGYGLAVGGLVRPGGQQRGRDVVVVVRAASATRARRAAAVAHVAGTRARRATGQRPAQASLAVDGAAGARAAAAAARAAALRL